jgi:hypothetical protein
MLRLGLFHQFKGADTLLLTGTAHDIADLSHRLEEFAASPDFELPLHGFAQVSASHPAQLFACRTAQPPLSGFGWPCSPELLPSVQGKLHAVASSGNRHQYFDLIGSPIQLMVSVGEYADSWWSAGA